MKVIKNGRRMFKSIKKINKYIIISFSDILIIINYTAIATIEVVDF